MTVRELLEQLSYYAVDDKVMMEVMVESTYDYVRGDIRSVIGTGGVVTLSNEKQS